MDIFTILNSNNDNEYGYTHITDYIVHNHLLRDDINGCYITIYSGFKSLYAQYNDPYKKCIFIRITTFESSYVNVFDSLNEVFDYISQFIKPIPYYEN